MLKRIIPLFVLALVGLSILPGCSSMSKSGRQQARYAKYVSKYSNKRVKQKGKIKAVKMPLTPQSKTVVNASVSDAPQSASSNPGE